MSRVNLEAFLQAYLAAQPVAAQPEASGGGSGSEVGAGPPFELMLEELVAETLAAEPLTWLEAVSRPR